MEPPHFERGEIPILKDEVIITLLMALLIELIALIIMLMVVL